MNRLSIGTLALLIAGFGTGCAVAASTDSRASNDVAVDSRADSIQGGSADSGDPAVGMLVSSFGAICSGVLIAPDVVLTAGHCVQNTFDAFYTGSGAAGTTRVRRDVDGQAASPDYDRGFCPNSNPDIGLVHLANPIADIAPLPYSKAAPPTSGECTQVGFGRWTNPDTGTTYIGGKRKAQCSLTRTAVNAVQCTWVDGIADKGDSGGPLICDGVVIAVTSCGSSSPTHTTGWFARTDNTADWIAGQIASFVSD